MASFDQAGYQNRWASYNDPTSSFHPGNLAGFSHLSNEPKLSSEGKRQVCYLDDLRKSSTSMHFSRAVTDVNYACSLS